MPQHVIFIFLIFKEKLVFSLNDTETMMRFVSIMKKNVRGYKGESVFFGRQTIKMVEQTGYVLKIVTNSLILAVIFQAGPSIPRS